MILRRLAESALIPVVVLEHSERAIDTADALAKGDVHVMEITLRTDAALVSIEKLSQLRPSMCTGAGTVLTPSQAEECVDAGAQFIVSPGYSQSLVDWCIERCVPIIPGCVTPTEILMAYISGLRVVKYFPANIYGGVSALKGLIGPFGEMRFIPTGGINASNFLEYLSVPCVQAVGGSWICDRHDINEGRFDKITKLCRDARESINNSELCNR